jgi:hypothetical protein
MKLLPAVSACVWTAMWLHSMQNQARSSGARTSGNRLVAELSATRLADISVLR